MRSTYTKFIATACLIASAFTVSAQAHPWGGPGWGRGPGPGWGGGGYYHHHHGGGLAAGLAIGALSGMVIGNAFAPRVIAPSYPVTPPPTVVYPGYGNNYGYNYGYGYSAPPVIVAPPPPPPIVGPPIYSGW